MAKYGSRKRLAFYVIFFTFFLAVISVGSSAEAQIIQRGDQERRTKFVKHQGRFLDVVPIRSEKVDDAIACGFVCLENTRCSSLNLATTADEGKYECQLLATDKYNSRDQLVPSDELDHYGVKVGGGQRF